MSGKSSDDEPKVGYSQANVEIITRKVGLRAEYIPPQQDVRLYIPYLPADMFDVKGIRQSALNIMKTLNMITWYFNLGISYTDGNGFSGFILNYRMDVNKSFYSKTPFNYPLLLESCSDYVKRTSRRCSVRMTPAGQVQPIAVATWTSVNIDIKTKRPLPFPEEWKQKHRFPKDGPILDIYWPLKPKTCVVENFHRVIFSYLDENKHTNFTSYVSMCLDSFYENIIKQRYPNNSPVFLNGWLETMEIVFRGDSQLDDLLTVSSWQNSKRNNKFYFEIKKETNTITLLSLQFYSSLEENSRL